ncbi:MAG: hypothetical protein AVDCRST_MAG18-2116, partial [uncultured Thermomicrobiales bacterium]
GDRSFARVPRTGRGRRDGRGGATLRGRARRRAARPRLLPVLVRRSLFLALHADRPQRLKTPGDDRRAARPQLRAPRQRPQRARRDAGPPDHRPGADPQGDRADRGAANPLGPRLGALHRQHLRGAGRAGAVGLARRRPPHRDHLHRRRWRLGRPDAALPRREPGDRAPRQARRSARPAGRGGVGPRRPRQPRRGAEGGRDRQSGRARRHPDDQPAGRRPRRAADRDRPRRPRRRTARPPRRAHPPLRHARGRRDRDRCLGRDRARRARRRGFRLGRPRGARQGPLLRRQRPVIPDRVRQHPERREPHPLRLARLHQRFWRRPPRRPLRRDPQPRGPRAL